MKQSAAKWACLIPIIGILLLPFAGYFLRELRTSDGRKALPAEAAHVEEWLVHGMVGGDFTRLLKASLPAERYSDYAASLGLSERFAPQQHHNEATLNMKMGDAPGWWNPPEIDSTSYFQYKEGDDYLRVLRYRNGSVYLSEHSW
jgi:hypothetical protein